VTLESEDALTTTGPSCPGKDELEWFLTSLVGQRQP